MNSPFDVNERCWIVTHYLLCQEKKESIRDKFIQTFAVGEERSKTFHRQQFRKVYERFLQHKSVKDNCGQQSNGRSKSSITPESIENVRDKFQAEPRTSVAKASREIGLHPSTIHRKLGKELKMKPQDGI